MSEQILTCIKSWEERLPEYKLMLWNEQNFDVNSVTFTRQAYKYKKWSFVTDYVRLHALNEYGGIYMDTDVVVFKSLDKFLINDFFSAVEYHDDIFQRLGKGQLDCKGKLIKDSEYVEGIGILVALMGSIPRHPVILELLHFFEKALFERKNGTLFTDIIHPAIAAKVLEKYGFVYKNVRQVLDQGITIYPDSVFTGSRDRLTNEAYALHIVSGSWRDTFLQRFKRSLVRLLKGQFLLRS